MMIASNETQKGEMPHRYYVLTEFSSLKRSKDLTLWRQNGAWISRERIKTDKKL